MTRGALAHAVQLSNAVAWSQSVSESSNATYMVGWRSWLRSCTYFNINPNCQHPSGRTMFVEELYLPISQFVGVEIGIRQVAPDSIRKVYLPGIANHLIQLQRVTNFSTTCNSSHIKGLFTGYNRNWIKKHPDANNVKIPFGLTLASSAKEALRIHDITLEALNQHNGVILKNQELLIKERLFLCLIMGIFFLLRKGEYLPSNRVKKDRNGAPIGYQLTRNMITFYTDLDYAIPYNQIGIKSATSVKLTILFSKADATGKGRVLVHYRQRNDSPICIVREMEQWIARSRDTYHLTVNDLMWDIPGLPRLTCDTIAILMKTTCDLVGLPADKESTHSLRYGGATTLAAAGYPEYIIAFYGGWAEGSKAMKRYIRPSNSISRTVSHQMASAECSMHVQKVVNQLMKQRVEVTDNTIPTGKELGKPGRGKSSSKRP